MFPYQHRAGDACNDDGLETPGQPADDEPTDPNIEDADLEYEAPDFAPLPEDEEG